jgi:hypothetical protein
MPDTPSFNLESERYGSLEEMSYEDFLALSNDGLEARMVACEASTYYVSNDSVLFIRDQTKYVMGYSPNVQAGDEEIILPARNTGVSREHASLSVSKSESLRRIFEKFINFTDKSTVGSYLNFLGGRKKRVHNDGVMEELGSDLPLQIICGDFVTYLATPKSPTPSLESAGLKLDSNAEDLEKLSTTFRSKGTFLRIDNGRYAQTFPSRSGRNYHISIRGKGYNGAQFLVHHEDEIENLKKAGFDVETYGVYNLKDDGEIESDQRDPGYTGKKCEVVKHEKIEMKIEGKEYVTNISDIFPRDTLLNDREKKEIAERLTIARHFFEKFMRPQIPSEQWREDFFEVTDVLSEADHPFMKRCAGVRWDKAHRVGNREIQYSLNSKYTIDAIRHHDYKYFYHLVMHEWLHEYDLRGKDLNYGEFRGIVEGFQELYSFIMADLIPEDISSEAETTVLNDITIEDHIAAMDDTAIDRITKHLTFGRTTTEYRKYNETMVQLAKKFKGSIGSVFKVISRGHQKFFDVVGRNIYFVDAGSGMNQKSNIARGEMILQQLQLRFDTKDWAGASRFIEEELMTASAATEIQY